MTKHVKCLFDRLFIQYDTPRELNISNWHLLQKLIQIQINFNSFKKNIYIYYIY